VPAAAAEIAGCLQNFGLKFVGGGRGIFLEHAQEAFVTEFFVVSVGRLGNTVGVENDAVAGFQMGRAQGERLVREDAEDATMEIFMKLRDKLIQYDETRSFSAWLYKVAANHCWDLLRRRKIRQDKETDDVADVPLEHPDPNQLDRMIEQSSSDEVRRALGKLGARARMALVMRYYSDMSYDEIADALGVRRAFVGVVLLRARHELRQALGETGALAAGGAS